MFVGEFFQTISKLVHSNEFGVEDKVDKFLYTFTMAILLTTATIASLKQYLFRAIDCYISSSHSGAGILEFVHSSCWIHGTIPIGTAEKIDKEWMNRFRIPYYQWVPFFISFQCILYNMPRYLWRIFWKYNVDLDIDYILFIATKATTEHHIEKSHQAEIMIKNALKSISSKGRAIWFNVAFLTMKITFIINVCVQLVFMKLFLAVGWFFGPYFIKNIMRGQDWQLSSLFPREGFCPVNLRLVGSTVRVSAQCAFPVNMYNKIIFTLLWFWMTFAAILEMMSILIWMFRLLFHNSEQFIASLLVVERDLLLRKFIRTQLRPDGVLILRLVCANAGTGMARNIANKIWESFVEKESMFSDV